MKWNKIDLSNEDTLPEMDKTILAEDIHNVVRIVYRGRLYSSWRWYDGEDYVYNKDHFISWAEAKREKGKSTKKHDGHLCPCNSKIKCLMDLECYRCEEYSNWRKYKSMESKKVFTEEEVQTVVVAYQKVNGGRFTFKELTEKLNKQEELSSCQQFINKTIICIKDWSKDGLIKLFKGKELCPEIATEEMAKIHFKQFWNGEPSTSSMINTVAGLQAVFDFINKKEK